MTSAEALNGGHTVGLEKEFYVVDRGNSTTYQSTVVARTEARMREEMDAYDASVGPKCYLDCSGPVEVTTRPCKDLAKLTEDVCTAYGIAREEADRLGAYALGMGTRPGKPKDQAGLHVHVGFKNEGEARYVFKALQEHVPDIMAISANSPSGSGRVKDMRMDGGYYGHDFDGFDSSGRTSVIYKRTNTVEVRCMDSQGTPEEDAAVAAYIFGIAEKAKEDRRNGVDVGEAGDEERENFERAIKSGMDASFVIGGETVPASQVVEETFSKIRPYLERYECPANVLAVLEDKVARRRSGADDILDIYEEVGRPDGLWSGLKSLFGFKADREELYRRLSHR